MNFTAIDFETGMYSAESAISVGLVTYIDGVKADSYYSLIRPPKLYIRPDFTKIHGLTVRDVKDAPTFDTVWYEGIKPFIGKYPLAAHNAPFDMSVLSAALAWYRIPVPLITYTDSLYISRRVWPELPSHRLTFLAEYFGITYNAHNALDDADTCARIITLAEEEMRHRAACPCESGDGSRAACPCESGDGSRAACLDYNLKTIGCLL